MGAAYPGASRTPVQERCCPMNDAERLAAYRKMQDFVDRRLADTTARMDRLRAEGKKKTATYRQLLGDKLQYQNVMELYKMFGL